MNSCNEARKSIDEAEKPDLLAFDATEHIERCSECERFASERAALRKLLASTARVSAPMNFDAALNARLAEVKSRRSLWRLSAPGYLRLGAATAGLAVMIFAAQYAGLFSREANLSPQPQNTAVEGAVTLPDKPATPVVIPPSVAPVASEHQNLQSTNRIKRHDVPVGRRFLPAGSFSPEDGGVVIVRGQNGEMDIQMPTVSVGAQPLLLVGAGRRVTTSGATSF